MGLTDIFSETDRIYFCDGELKYTGFQSSRAVPPFSEFYSINPLSENWQVNALKCVKMPATPRFSLNVAEFKNFVFESDVLPLEEQVNEWFKLSKVLPIKLLTYSGGKSYHAVISTLDTLPFEPHTAEGVEGYKQAWKALKTYIQLNSTLKLDESTKDPARLTRVPNALRGVVKQQSIELPCSRYATSFDIMRIMATYQPVTVKVGPKHTGELVNSRKLNELLNLHKHERLSHRLNIPEKWAASEGMYPLLLRLTLWAIDEVGPQQEAWTELLESKVFPVIRAKGYVRDLTVPIQAAYAMKGK